MEKWDSGKDIDERRKCMEQKSSQSDNQEIGGVLPTNNYPTISFDTLDSLLMEYLEESKKENQNQVAENSMFPPSFSPTSINGEQKIDGKIKTCFPEVLNSEEEKTKNSEDPGQNLAKNPCRSGTLQPTLPKLSCLLLSRDPLQFSMTIVNELPEDQTRETESESKLERRKKEPKNKKRPRNRESQDMDVKISKTIEKHKRLPHPSGPDHMELGLGLAGLNVESTFHSQEPARDQESQNLGQENYKNIDWAEKNIRDKDVQKTCPNKTGGRIQNEDQKSSPLKDKEKGRALQSTSHTFDVLDTLLDKLSEQNNEPSHNQETDTHHPLIPMKKKQKTGEKDLANFQQNYGPEESKSKQHGVPGSSLTDYKSTEKLQSDVPTHINLPHPNSQLENLPFPETDPSNEQEKESKGKKRKKKNKARKLRKRKKKEALQMTLRCLLQIVQAMEKNVNSWRKSLTKSKH